MHAMPAQAKQRWRLRNGMHHYVSLVGRRFGRWTVLSRAGSNNQCKSRWLCRCDCGVEKVVSRPGLRAGSRSCGCLTLEIITTHGASKSPTFRVWTQMNRRCHGVNPDRNYHGRGITVCDRWRHSFENFFADMGERPSVSYSLGRIDNDGNYEPGNCRWETQTQQCNNKRDNHRYTWRGETLTIAQWGLRAPIPYETLRGRLYTGWDFERAMTTPKVYRGK